MKAISSGQGHGVAWGVHSGSLYPTPTACLSLRPMWDTGPRLPVLRLDSTVVVLHSGKEKGGDQKMGIFQKVEREAEKPEGFPAKIL